MQELSNTIAGKYEEIVENIIKFSNQYLNEQYKDICIKATKTLCLNNEADLKKGKSSSWAAGIVHAIGSVNNLFDAKDVPYVKALDLYKAFEVSSSTGLSKSKEVKRLLNINDENNEWVLEGVKTAQDEVAVDKIEEVHPKAEEVQSNKEDAFKFKIDPDYIRAQRIVNFAWKQKNFNAKAKLAKEALSVYENCADAYIILSRDLSLKADEKTEILNKAVEAAKNSLNITDMESTNPIVFRRRESEPLFGAKYTLAMHLWNIGKKEEAIKEAFDVLNYAVNDELMVRVILSCWLLIEGDHERAEKVLNTYENDTLVAVNYNKAALYYKLGNIKEAEKSLRKAYLRNKLVIPYITKKKKPNLSVLNSAVFGREEEAVQYASLALDIWNDADMINWVNDKKMDFEIERRK